MATVSGWFRYIASISHLTLLFDGRIFWESQSRQPGEGIISLYTDRTQISRPGPLLLPAPECANLTFKRAFWVIATAIFAIQMFEILLWILYGFEGEDNKYAYYLMSAVGGLAWYFVVTLWLFDDMEKKKMIPGRVLAFSMKKLQESAPTALRYFGIAALAMIVLSALLPSSDLLPETDSPLITVLTIVAAIIAAPICEEIWFRGYLYPTMLSKFKRPKERMVVNAMLFAGAHVFLLSLFVGAGVPYYIFVLGYLLARLYETYRSIIPCVLLHALNNILAMILDYIDPHSLLIPGQ